MAIRPSNSPLAVTLATLDAADRYRRYSTDCPADGGWVSAQVFLEQPSILDGLLEAAAVELRGNRDAAASLVAGRLVDGFVEPAAQALGFLGRTWPLTPGALAIRTHAQGWIDGIGVTDPAVIVIDGDEFATHADSIVVPDIDAMRARLADDAVTLLTPLFAAVRARAPFGLAGMWGNCADGLASAAVWGAFERGHDTAEAFANTDLLVDELKARVPRLRARPRPLTVPTSAGLRTAVGRGTCCLWYKSAAQPGSDDYCHGCPLTDDTEQVARLAAYMAHQS